jgi:hypothetical protein
MKLGEREGRSKLQKHLNRQWREIMGCGTQAWILPLVRYFTRPSGIILYLNTSSGHTGPVCLVPVEKSHA